MISTKSPEPILRGFGGKISESIIMVFKFRVHAFGFEAEGLWLGVLESEV